jgi:putative Mg2+ transporter-C (MgtC) family protein
VAPEPARLPYFLFQYRQMEDDMITISTAQFGLRLSLAWHGRIGLGTAMIRGEQDDTNEQAHIRAEMTTAGRNNEAIEQVVMRLSIEDDVSTLSWSIAEPE